MNNHKQAITALLLALLFLLPAAGMLQNDPSESGSDIPVDGSALTNEHEIDPTGDTSTSDAADTGETTPGSELDDGFEVNAEGERSTKKFLDAFKLNFDPYDPRDGDEVECIATVHNFGTERQIAYDVNVDFWREDEYIGTGYIDEIRPGENGTTSITWKAVYGSHMMRIIADPDGSDGGPDEYELLLNVSRTDYSPSMDTYRNDSWIRNSDTNRYYIRVINQGERSDTINLRHTTKLYGENPQGWTIGLDRTSVTLDSDESTYVTLSVAYQLLDPDYTAEAVVRVIAESEGDSSQSFETVTTTNVIRDVPILYVDDDGQHEDQPRMSYNIDTDGIYGCETDEINLRALEKYYKDMYHVVRLEGNYMTSGGTIQQQGESGPPYDSSSGTSPFIIDGKRVYLKDYDVVIWDTGFVETLNAEGYDWDRSNQQHAWYDQTELMKYMDNGGSFIWLNNQGMEQHDSQAGFFENPLFTDYFFLERGIRSAGRLPRIVGDAAHPVSKGIDVENSVIWSLAGDRSDALWFSEPARGLYYSGVQYNSVAVERPRISSTQQRYRAIYQSMNWASFGGSYWHYYDDPSPIREQAVLQTLTWLGVPHRIAGEYDLEIESIASPLGTYVQPNQNIPLAVNVRNVGNKEITRQFEVVFKVVDRDSGNTVFQRTEQVNDDLVPGEIIEVSTSWSSNRPVEGGKYNVTFEILFDHDYYDDNNVAYTHQEGKLLRDVGLLTANYEKSVFYWNATRPGDPTEIWCVVNNHGSVPATFDVHMVINSPLKTEVYSRTTRVENLRPGEERRLSWVWIPRNPAGIYVDWHTSVKRNEIRDTYEALFMIDWDADEVEENNVIGIGHENAQGIVVMGYCDMSEPRMMTEDWYKYDLSNHDNHGNEWENTPLHLTTLSFVSPTHAWAAGYYDGPEGSLPIIKNGWSTVAISPAIDLREYTEARANWLMGGLSGSGTMYWELSRNYSGDPEDIESATWTSIAQTSGYSGTPYQYYINTAGYNIDSWVGDIVYMRLRFVSSSGGGPGPFVDEMAISGVVSQYNANDLGVTMVAVNPLIDEREMPRDIAVTVQNFGENKTNSDGRPGFEVVVRIENDQGQGVYNKNAYVNEVLGIGETHTVHFDSNTGKAWLPAENGIYTISATVVWEQNGKNIDENLANNMMVIDGIVQRNFFSDDMESGPGDWVVTGEPGGWELGTPEGELSPSAFSGDNCWATNLKGNYPHLNGRSITLEHYVDLRTAMDPTLSFWHWLEVEAHGYDTAYVEARTADQSSYTVLWMNPSPERRGVPFRTNGWEIVTLNLEDFAYHEVYIRFRLRTDGDINYLGWYIDDVAVGGTRPPDYDARTVSIDSPVEGSFIPPGESIEVKATVMNVGLNEDFIPVTAKAFRLGASPVEYDLGTKNTQVLGPGEREQVSFSWTLPPGTYQYRVEVKTELRHDENPDNDMQIQYFFARRIYDIAIRSLYADPMVQDVARTRQVTAEVQNVGNTPLANNVQLVFDVMFQGAKVHEHIMVVSLERGEISPMSWEWQSFKYGDYEIRVTGSIIGETEDNLDDNTMTLDGIMTVETIFSDTREKGDSPMYYDRDVGDFVIWNWRDHGTTFWSGDNMTGDPHASGWHVVDTGHFSRWGWYGGVPARDRYTNNMRATLISQPLNLRGYSNVQLSFFTKYIIEGRHYDYVEIAASPDPEDRDSWRRIVKFPEDHQSHDSSRTPGNVYGWIHWDVSIPDAYLWETFHLRIMMITDSGITFQGVFIDDLTIYGRGTGNHPPVARFTASVEDEDEDSYSRRVIQNPPVGLFHIRGNQAFNNLPRPVGGRQGGIMLGVPIEFDASLSFDPDPGDDTLSYTWNFGDGYTANGRQVQHSYTGDLPLEGYFTVTLRVTDGHGASSQDTMHVWIGNKPPEADYIVTSAFDTATPLPVEDGVINVFYGDNIIFQQRSTDPEGDPLTFEWVFKCVTTNYITRASGDSVAGIVGKDFLYEGLDGTLPIVPVTRVRYEVTIYVSDPFSTSEKTYVIQVHPYATADFEKPVQIGTTILEATVTLTWRGFYEEAAPQASMISPDRPVFVHINDNAVSPDPNLHNRGGIGKVYDIRAVGCYLQNGEPGFISAVISIPILTSDLEKLGDSFSLQDDLRLERYDELEKRFFAVEGSRVISDGGVKYVVGEVDHFSIFAAIVDSIYNPANPKYSEVLPDLEVVEIEFSRSPAQNGQEVEVRAFVRNNGKTHARNVDVKIYDGDDLVADTRIELVPASRKETIIVRESFTVIMLDPTLTSENHIITCFVNKQRAINEGAGNYRNNEKSELLQVTSVQMTTPSFGASAMMTGLAVALAAIGSAAVIRKSARRRDGE